MQSVLVIRGWPCAKCRSMMFAGVQAVGFSDESMALEQHSTDEISALIIHTVDRISAFIIHMCVHGILRKISICIVYAVTVQHFIKFNITELNMQTHDIFNLFSSCFYNTCDHKTKNRAACCITKAIAVPV